jgi:hypothetical protein
LFKGVQPSSQSARAHKMRGYLQDMRTRFATRSAFGTRFSHSGQGEHMARSTRNDAQRQSAPKGEPGLPDLVELAGSEVTLIGESGAALESLNLGHAGLRNECWAGESARGLGRSRSEFAPPLFAAQRLRGARRRRPQLPHSRPSYRAEARLTPDNREILTF